MSFSISFDGKLGDPPEGHTIMSPYKITDVEKGLSSLVTWEEIKPEGTNIKVYFGLTLNNEGTLPPAWYEVQNGGSIPFIKDGYLLKDKYLWAKVCLYADDTSVLPELIRLVTNVNGKNAVWDIRRGTFTYLKDYRCGDIIHAQHRGVAEMHGRIIEVKETYTPEEVESHSLILGRTKPDIQKLIREQERNVGPEVRR